mgnify:CR=1 FL=1
MPTVARAVRPLRPQTASAFAARGFAAVALVDQTSDCKDPGSTPTSGRSRPPHAARPRQRADMPDRRRQRIHDWRALNFAVELPAGRAHGRHHLRPMAARDLDAGPRLVRRPTLVIWSIRATNRRRRSLDRLYRCAGVAAPAKERIGLGGG